MTDLEKFKDLYKSFGIDVIVSKCDDGYDITLGESCCYEDDCTFSDKFGGYYCFFTRICFDKDGKFVEQGFWE